MAILDRIKHAWNAFTGNETYPNGESIIYNSHRSGARGYLTTRSKFVAPIFNRIAVDTAMTKFNHVVVNKENEDVEEQDSGLNYCLNVEANVDQTAIQFMQDLVYSLLDEGQVAVVPVDTTLNPKITGAFDVNTMRVGKVIGYTTKSVNVRLYNDIIGDFKDIWLPKTIVAIIESPLYSVLNAPNSTLQRLLTKMNQLDNMDSYFSNNRLDLIIQLPQGLRTEKQKEAANKRILEIDRQLAIGNNGVAYIDGTEKITQLNRPANSQLVDTIDRLEKTFYNQIGMTESIFNGTASEVELRNYYNRTIDPIVAFIIQEMNRKFLTKTARTRGHTIEHYRDILKFVSVEQLIGLGDALRRNEIATSNEIRKVIGFRRSNEPSADRLSNPNIADSNKGLGTPPNDEGGGDVGQNEYNSSSNGGIDE